MWLGMVSVDASGSAGTGTNGTRGTLSSIFRRTTIDRVHSELRIFFEGGWSFPGLNFILSKDEIKKYKSIYNKFKSYDELNPLLDEATQSISVGTQQITLVAYDRLILASAYLVALHKADARSECADFEKNRKEVEKSLQTLIEQKRPTLFAQAQIMTPYRLGRH